MIQDISTTSNIKQENVFYNISCFFSLTRVLFRLSQQLLFEHTAKQTVTGDILCYYRS